MDVKDSRLNQCITDLHCTDRMISWPNYMCTFLNQCSPLTMKICYSLLSASKCFLWRRKQANYTHVSSDVKHLQERCELQFPVPVALVISKPTIQLLKIYSTIWEFAYWEMWLVLIYCLTFSGHSNAFCLCVDTWWIFLRPWTLPSFHIC